MVGKLDKYHSEKQCASSHASKHILFWRSSNKSIFLQNLDVADSGEMNTMEYFPCLTSVKIPN